ncbi:MAG: 2-hydroxychromene-2-carboxylate isomerase [Polyangiales bacterium]
MTVELFFDFGSTYSYPAVMLAERRAAERAVPIAFRPILLGPIFQAQGYTQPPFVQFTAKGQYTFRDLQRICDDLGLPWKKPSVFPRRSVLAARIALIGLDEGWGAEFCRRVYLLNFAEDRDIDDETNLRALLHELGRAPDEVLARALSDGNRARLREATARAQSLGVFGAPTFVVGDEVFWGHDRMEHALRWATRLTGRP